MSLSDFEIGDTLGKGAYGSVCVVVRKLDNSKYAMKRVNISKLSKSDLESALNEIRILASLNHRNVIGYKEAFYDEQSNTLNIIMELADDGDLSRKIKLNQETKRNFNEKTIWNIFIQILNGLKYLHDNKIIHRDLKSANIFLNKNGDIKIGDLNVSKIAKLGMATTQTGTPYYASPEIWKDKPYDSKTDIWSVGCIVYEMCTLKPPFRGKNIPNLAQNIQKGVYPAISKYYTSDLAKIIKLMLNVNPAKRPNCDELLTNNIVLMKINELFSPSLRNGNLNYGNNNNTGNNNMAFCKQDILEAISSNSKADLIQTIKIPYNMKDINSKLPSNKYKDNEDMMEHDEYETSKQQGFFKLAQMSHANNNTNNNKINNNNNMGNNANINPDTDNTNNDYNNSYDDNVSNNNNHIIKSVKSNNVIGRKSNVKGGYNNHNSHNSHNSKNSHNSHNSRENNNKNVIKNNKLSVDVKRNANNIKSENKPIIRPSTGAKPQIKRNSVNKPNVNKNNFHGGEANIALINNPRPKTGRDIRPINHNINNNNINKKPVPANNYVKRNNNGKKAIITKIDYKGKSNNNNIPKNNNINNDNFSNKNKPLSSHNSNRLHNNKIGNNNNNIKINDSNNNNRMVNNINYNRMIINNNNSNKKVSTKPVAKPKIITQANSNKYVDRPKNK